jgi:hypothetical protein
MKSIIYIHHSRDIESADCYLHDDYAVANQKLYGAQELDTWARFRILSQKFNMMRVEIIPNLKLVRAVNFKGDIVFAKHYKTAMGLKRVFDLGYLRSLMKFMDPSIAQFGYSDIRRSVSEILRENQSDLIWSDTQFYESAIPKKLSHIVRSVNFEPYHSLTESQGFRRYIRALAKLWSENRVVRNCSLICISPLDAKRYLGTTFRRVPILPLSQLGWIGRLDPQPINQSKTFLIMGSTYEVLHNRRNLEFILQKIAPKVWEIDKTISFQIFGNRIPTELSLPENCEYMGFDKSLHARILGSSAVVVPFNGGAGMQSKIFEPLMLGALLIANPKSLVGYGFSKNHDYLPAITVNEYVKAIVSVASNIDEYNAIKISARKKSLDLFNYEVSADQIYKLVNAHYSDR